MDKKIIVGAGFFVDSEEDCERAIKFSTGYGAPIQLGFFSRDDAKNYMTPMLSVEDWKKGGITSIHLPNGLYADDFKRDGFVDSLMGFFGVDHFVVHPWAVDLDEIVEVVMNRGVYTLTLETFAGKDSALTGKGSPFTLIGKYGREMLTPNLGLCFDFSHLVSPLLLYETIKGFLPYTKAWHVSGRIGKDQHLPVLKKGLGVNMSSLLSRLFKLKYFPVERVILEYMPEYQNKELGKDYFWLLDLITTLRRRRYGDV